MLNFQLNFQFEWIPQNLFHRTRDMTRQVAFSIVYLFIFSYVVMLDFH